MKNYLCPQSELVKSVINKNDKNLLKLIPTDNKVKTEELYELNEFINRTLYEYTGSSSIVDNVVNIDFTWMGKPYLIKIELNELHYKIWKENGIIRD